jgi:hypothetical protein
MELKVSNTPEGEKKFVLRRESGRWGGGWEEVALIDIPKEVWVKQLNNTYSNEPLCPQGCAQYVTVESVRGVGYFVKGIKCAVCNQTFLRVRKKNQKDEVKYFTTKLEVAF